MNRSSQRAPPMMSVSGVAVIPGSPYCREWFCRVWTGLWADVSSSGAIDTGTKDGTTSRVLDVATVVRVSKCCLVRALSPVNVENVPSGNRGSPSMPG